MPIREKEIEFVQSSDLMLVQINDIVASMMVLPNRQVFPLVTDIQTGHLRWSNPQVNQNESSERKFSFWNSLGCCSSSRPQSS